MTGRSETTSEAENDMFIWLSSTSRQVNNDPVETRIKNPTHSLDFNVKITGLNHIKLRKSIT